MFVSIFHLYPFGRTSFDITPCATQNVTKTLLFVSEGVADDSKELVSERASKDLIVKMQQKIRFWKGLPSQTLELIPQSIANNFFHWLRGVLLLCQSSSPTSRLSDSGIFKSTPLNKKTHELS